MDNLEQLDFIKRRVIVALFSNRELSQRLVLKGGNLLDIVYQVSARSSLDLDFSIEGVFDDVPWLLEAVDSALKQTLSRDGFAIFDVVVKEQPPQVSSEMEGFWGGYEVRFKIIEQEHDFEALRRSAIAVGKRGSTNFHIDISKHEYCGNKQAHEFEGARIYVYSPEMLICEKLRAICQQMPEYRATVKKHLAGRARDFVDIKLVAEEFLVNFAGDGFRRLLAVVFAAKRVPLRLLLSISQYRDDHRSDFEAVRATMKPGFEIEEFDAYVDYTVRRCRDLKPLGNE